MKQPRCKVGCYILFQLDILEDSEQGSDVFVHLMLLTSGGGSCEVLVEGHDCVHGTLVIICRSIYNFT